MSTFSANGITLEQVREHVWKMPKEGSMRVPGIVLASEVLLEEISGDNTLQQLRNTTELPGIQKHAICMPDGHQGYGFPVGGVAGIDAETGCISPGAVGYDINCLTGNSEVRIEFGRRLHIRDLEDTFEQKSAIVKDNKEVTSRIQLFTKTDNKAVREIRTATGDTLRTTPNHEFLTPEGKTQLGELEPGDPVYIDPFRGVENEPPEEFVVLSEEDFANEDPQLIQVLKDRDILPLRSTDEAFNRLIKLVGYHTGDGSFSSCQTWFYGEPEDLESIREDIKEIGFKPSTIYEREREHDINGNRFNRTEYSVKSGSNAFKQLLIRLGTPEGKKVESRFTTPYYLNRLPNWQRALYLSAFFGAEMSTPAPIANMNLYCPKISQTRVSKCVDAGEQFMREIAGYLAELEIETNQIERFDAVSKDDSFRLRLGIKSNSENLVRFFTTIGYRYNLQKQKMAVKAVQYLKEKSRVIEHRGSIAKEARAMADGGTPVTEIPKHFPGHESFAERSARGRRVGRPRPPQDFPGFEEFCENTHVRDNLTIETEIESITEVGREPVYDIGVAHDAHNFVANGFVVSNCGVRMVKTNLEYSDVQGREEELVNELFDRIPSGLGGGGIVEGSMGAVNAILDRGMEWALEEGYATREDLLHCEDEGSRPESDPSKVSQNAKDRGKNQIGSLGSGNHFLEVQRVTDVFLPDVGEAFGLSEDQIVVLIHCGSRGLGHQTCTDYLRKIEKTHSELLSQLPDKELAAAPAGSQLAEEYYQAMGAAINYAWVNRQLIMYEVRRVFADVFGQSWESLGMDLLYDVAHNIAKKESHEVNGDERELYVHRKGATRAFPSGHESVPSAYRSVGQPIIIPGSMGSGSYVLRGGAEAMGLTFGSTAHGAGRVMSRTQAKKEYWGEDVRDDLREQQKVYVKAQSGATIAEEAPGVYKDVDEVVRVSDELGIGDKVARTYPVCNIKG